MARRMLFSALNPAVHVRSLAAILILMLITSRPGLPALASARRFLAGFLGLSLLAVSAVSAAEPLIDITAQSIDHYKYLSISVFGQGTILAGENATYSAGPGAPSFTNEWTGSTTSSGVTVNGTSTLDYAFSNDTFTFSVAVDSSHSGTSTQSITALPRGGGDLSITFTLNQAATVYFALTGLANNNGNGGGGGSPYANGSLQVLSGYDEDFGFPMYDNVFPYQDVFDSSVGNGGAVLDFSSSALLAPGTYRLRAAANTQNAYQQPNAPNVSSSEQSASVNLTARFEAVPEPGSAMLLMMSGAGLLLRRRRRTA